MSRHKPIETHTTFCRICEALCGLEVDVRGGQVAAIRPDGAHVVTGGFACLKGLNQHHMYASPDRLQYPLERRGDRFVRVSWEEALDGIGKKLRSIVGRTSPDSVAMYVGTAAGFGALHPIFAQGFMQGVGSASVYSTATQDCANKFAASTEIYGFPFTLPFPDIDHTDCLIIVGANPAVSKWSFLQVSNPVQRLKEIERRGASLFVVDPRRTETAKAAGSHVFIRPNTDIYFYLSFLREVIRIGGVDHTRVRRYMRGFEEIAALVKPWTPQRTAKVTKIPAATLRQMAKAYVEAEAAALYMSTGVNMGTHGTLCYWLQEVINAITGNLDRRGGTLVGRGIVDFPAFAKKNGLLTSKRRSRVGGLPSVNETLPGGVLADEILTPGDGQLRALFVTGGNPLITMANSARLRDAFRELELLVSVDIYLNETSSLAHYVLPATSPLERPDLPFSFPLFLGLQSRPWLQATRQIVPLAGEQRDEATIYLDLCRACGVDIFGSRIAQKLLDGARRLYSATHSGEHALPQERMLDVLLRVAKQPSFKTLNSKSPHGIKLPDHKPGSFLGRRVLTHDRMVHLAPSEYLAAAAGLDDEYERELMRGSELRLITKRAITTHNSWTHNIEKFTGPRNRSNYLYMHSDDARAAGLADGEVADVQSETGTVRIPIRILDDLMPGTVALPHGWGHQHARGLRVASGTEGVNVNLLAADGPDRLESVSGMANLTGIPVSVMPAEGPRNTSSWSGI